MNTTPRNEFLGGIQAELPILVGVIPFGMIYGALARSAGMPPEAAQAMSTVVFAGSSQFIMAQLWGQATPIFIILVTVLVVNLRHGLYSASIAPYVKHLSTAWKWLLSYLLTDEAYAVSIIRYRKEEENGGGKTSNSNRKATLVFLGAGWRYGAPRQISTSAGILLGAIIPESLSLISL
jgi:predicted branched-subunit amino acid permease